MRGGNLDLPEYIEHSWMRCADSEDTEETEYWKKKGHTKTIFRGKKHLCSKGAHQKVPMTLSNGA